MHLSDKQKKTLKLIGKLILECGNDRWFIQSELPGVTKHTMDALVDKGFLYCREGETNGFLYYKQMKPTNKEECDYWE